jgi:hypothetical protein
MVQTFAVDSRLPIPDGMSDNDPTHPKNVMRDAAIVQNQAIADTKYDPYPPPRISKDESERQEKEKRKEELRRTGKTEGFITQFEYKMSNGLFYPLVFGLVFLAVFLWKQGNGRGFLKGRARLLAIMAIASIVGLVVYRLVGRRITAEL